MVMVVLVVFVLLVAGYVAGCCWLFVSLAYTLFLSLF
jgi:hypothetical protein